MGRVVSLENELCLQFIPRDQRTIIGSKEGARSFFTGIGLPYSSHSGVWLANGTKLYIDRSGIEVANAECSTPEELVALDKANMEWIGEKAHSLNGLFYPHKDEGTQLQQELFLDITYNGRKKMVPGKVRLYKTNSDGKGHTLGTHENYQLFVKPLATRARQESIEAEPKNIFTYLERHLVPFLITRQLYTGGGGIDNSISCRDPSFVLSSRALFIQRVSGVDTTNNRPILNTKHEPWANQLEFMRLHLICGDANMSEFANYLKIGMTSLMLDYLENTERIPDLQVLEPVKDMWEVSCDLTGRTHKINLANKRRYSALELQMVYRDLLGNHLERHPDQTYNKVFSAFCTILEKIEQDGLLSTTQYTDFGLKYKLLEDLILRRGKTLLDPMAQTINLKYHWLDKDGLFNKIAQNVGHERIVSDDAIQRHKGEQGVPPHTRAAGRMYYARELEKRGHYTVIEWDNVHCGCGAHEGEEYRVLMSNPAKTYLLETEQYLQLIDQQRRR